MIDLHAHVLPGIDDGPEDLGGTLALARAAVAAGTTTIVATPHVDAFFGLGPADLGEPLRAVREAVAAEGLALTVEAGAEIALDRYLELTPEELAALRLGPGPYLLLEAPLAVEPGPFEVFLASLLARGVRVLLAHPERCPAFQRRPEMLSELVAAGALGQVTAGSLTGSFGRTVREVAVRMLDAGLVHVLASDAHDASHRGPDLRGGLERMARDLPGSTTLADWLTVEMPAAILAGEEPPPRPALGPPPPRRRLWRRAG